MNPTSKYDPRGPIPTIARGPRRKSIAEILARHAKTPGGCWEWTGPTNGHGYGLVNMWVGSSQTTFAPHRLQWMHCHGAVPEGMNVMHVCDNRKCINPDHLVLGTPQANLADMRAKGRGNISGLKGQQKAS